MFLRQFQYLVMLAQEKHFSRAAERCNVSQPSLSSAIKHLEHELGISIVLRDQRFQGFTSEGMRVVEWAKRMLADRDAMLQELAVMRENLRGHLRLGAMPTSSPVLPLFTERLGARHPGVQVDIRFLGIDEMKLGLANFELDVGVAYLDHDDLDRVGSLPVYSERLSLLVADAEPFRDRTSFTWAQAAELPLCLLPKSMHERRIADEAFASVGQRPRPRIESDSIINLAFHVMNGGLATVIPSHFVRVIGVFPGTRLLALREPLVSRQVGLIWAAGEPPLPMVTAMVGVVEDLNKDGHLASYVGPDDTA